MGNLDALKEAAGKKSIAELLKFWNTYEKPIAKFESKEKAVFAVRGLLTTLAANPNYKHEHHATPAAEEPKKGGRKPMTDEEKAAKADQKAKEKAELKAQQEKEREARKAKKEAEKAERAAKKASPAFRYEPNPTKAPHAVRVGSMVSKMIDLIARPQGATIAELEEVSYDTSHSVKSLLGYDMRNQVGYGYYSEDGVTVHILYPEGMTEPLTHVVKPEPKPKEVKPPKEPKAPKAKKGEAAPAPTGEQASA